MKTTPFAAVVALLFCFLGFWVFSFQQPPAPMQTPASVDTELLKGLIRQITALEREQRVAIPVGTITAYVGDLLPADTGWLECNGNDIPEGPQFAAIRSALGSTRLPDLRGKFLYGAKQGKAIREIVGEESRVIDSSYLPINFGGLLVCKQGFGLAETATNRSSCLVTDKNNDTNEREKTLSEIQNKKQASFEIIPPSYTVRWIIRY